MDNVPPAPSDTLDQTFDASGGVCDGSHRQRGSGLFPVKEALDVVLAAQQIMHDRAKEGQNKKPSTVRLRAALSSFYKAQNEI